MIDKAYNRKIDETDKKVVYTQKRQNKIEKKSEKSQQKTIK